MLNTDWKSDFGPFETEADKYHFWRFLLKKIEHIGDRETVDALHLAFVEWRRRQEDDIGVVKELEREARKIEYEKKKAREALEETKDIEPSV